MGQHKTAYDLTKPHWVFVGSNHYPVGGMADLYGTYDTAREASAAFRGALKAGEQWAQVLTLATGEARGFRINSRKGPVESDDIAYRWV